MPCTIGNRVGVGHRAILHGCTIEDEWLVGMGAIVLNGVHVGAGALLRQGFAVPPGSLVLGVPATVVRPMDARLRARVRSTWQH